MLDRPTCLEYHKLKCGPIENCAHASHFQPPKSRFKISTAADYAVLGKQVRSSDYLPTRAVLIDYDHGKMPLPFNFNLFFTQNYEG